MAVTLKVVERSYPVFTGTNSVGLRSLVVQLQPGDTLCAPNLSLPADTRFIRFKVTSGTPRPPIDVRLRAGGQVIRTGVGETPTGGLTAVDVPLPDRPGSPEAVSGRLCLTPRDQAIAIGGMANVYGGEPQSWVRVNGSTLRGTQIGVWFLPDGGERKSLVSMLPEIIERASLFRPSPVGPWLYYVLLLAVAPLLVFASVRLIAKGSAGLPAAVPVPLVIGAIAFSTAAAWALVTPAFDAPDETEHFAYAQYLAETGNAPARAPGPRGPWADEETIALDALHLPSYVEQPDGRPRWLEQDERRWREHNDAVRASRDNGGGATAATTHSPLYYGLLTPAYYAADGGSIFARLTAMRLTSALLGAVTAIFAYLLLMELFPTRRLLAIGAGLLVAFQPMFTFIAGAVNNDMGVNAAAAVLCYLLIRGLRRGPSTMLAAAIGIMLVVAPLAKGTALALYPAAGIALAGMLWRHHSRRDLVAYAVLGVALTASALSWTALSGVFDRSFFTTPGGTAPTASGGIGASVLDEPGAYLSYLWQEFLPRLPFLNRHFTESWPAFDIYVKRGWGAFGWYTIGFPHWVYVVIVTVMLTVAAAAAAAIVRYRRIARSVAVELLVLVAIIAGVIAGVAAAYFTPGGPRPGIAEQGRYAFTAIAPLAAVAVGACTVLGRRATPALVAALVTCVMGLYLASQLLALANFYA